MRITIFLLCTSQIAAAIYIVYLQSQLTLHLKLIHKIACQIKRNKGEVCKLIEEYIDETKCNGRDSDVTH